MGGDADKRGLDGFTQMEIEPLRRDMWVEQAQIPVKIPTTLTRRGARGAVGDIQTKKLKHQKPKTTL